MLQKVFSCTNNPKDYLRAIEGNPYWKVGDIVQPKGTKQPHGITKASEPNDQGVQDIEMYPINKSLDELMDMLQGGN